MKSGRKEAIGLLISIVVVITVIGYIIVSENQKQEAIKNANKLKEVSVSNTNTGTSTVVETKPDLEVLSKEDKYVDKYDYAIIGEVKNNRNYVMRNVFIRINLYDKDKKLLGDAIDRIDVLDANGIWKFKAPILNQYQKDFQSYKVVELNGYR